VNYRYTTISVNGKNEQKTSETGTLLVVYTVGCSAYQHEDIAHVAHDEDLCHTLPSSPDGRRTHEHKY